MEKIILAGDGHGCLSAYLGIKNSFQKIEIITNTKEIFANIKKSQDIFIEDPFQSNANIFLSAGYKPLIKQDLIDTKKCLNIHYALLPKYRGMHPVVWGILDNEEYLGWTLHEIDIGVDSGPLVYQYYSKNDGIRTAWSYVLEFDKNIEENLSWIMQSYLNKKLLPKEQDHKKAIWGFKRNLDDCRIDFSLTCDQIKNLFRVLNPPYPYPFIVYKDKKLSVTDYDLFQSSHSSLTLGRVANIDNIGAYIRIKDGYLIVKKLIDQDGKLINYYDNLKIGVRL